MRTKALLDAVITNAIDGIITINEQGIIETINPAACRLFRYAEADVIGRNVNMLMPPHDSQRHDMYLRNYKLSGESHIIGIGRDVLGRRKDGTVFPFRLGISEVTFEGQKIFAGFIHDLTYQKEEEDELKSSNTFLEDKVVQRTAELNASLEKELSKLKSRLLSMASHEFRTPLSTIQLSVALIDKYHDVEGFEMIKHVDRVKKSITGLTAILNDFLHLEKVESGSVELRTREFDLQEFCSEIAEEMRMLGKTGQVIGYRHTGPKNVELDRNLLRNCVLNLLSNAIKYSGEGSFIEFTTAISSTGCAITVKDQGIGIPLDEQPHLFEAFFRAQNTGNVPGTGLGLNIVSRYVALMGGTINFKSIPDKGTEFTLIFTNHEESTHNRGQ